MNLQELDKVVEIINHLGDKTLQGFIAYLGMNFAAKAMGYGVLIYFVHCMKKVSLSVARTISSKSAYGQVLERIRDTLNIGTSGPLCDSEIRAVIRKVEELSKGKS